MYNLDDELIFSIYSVKLKIWEEELHGISYYK